MKWSMIFWNSSILGKFDGSNLGGAVFFQISCEQEKFEFVTIILYSTTYAYFLSCIFFSIIWIMRWTLL